MEKYLDLAIANETIKTTDIKGKEYADGVAIWCI